MKLKIILSFLLITISLLITSCYTNKNFSKPEIENSIKVKSKVKTEWIKPSKDKCLRSGGEIENGECVANFNYAKDICSFEGGRLPKLKELQKAIVSCGGELNNAENINNSSFRSCYEKQGFHSVGWYWTSTIYSADTSQVYTIFFDSGNSFSSLKSYKNYVHCIK